MSTMPWFQSFGQEYMPNDEMPSEINNNEKRSMWILLALHGSKWGPNLLRGFEVLVQLEIGLKWWMLVVWWF